MSSLAGGKHSEMIIARRSSGLSDAQYLQREALALHRASPAARS
jgi:hypothetical protein